jgi:hypothetical protein
MADKQTHLVTDYRVRDMRDPGHYRIDTIFIKGGYSTVLGSYGVAVYNVLACMADNKTQEARPKQMTIADILNCSKRQVQRALDSLESFNIIKRHPQRRADGKRGTDLIDLIHRDYWLPPDSPRLQVDSQSPCKSQQVDSQSPCPVDSESTHLLSSLNLTNLLEEEELMQVAVENFLKNEGVREAKKAVALLTAGGVSTLEKAKVEWDAQRADPGRRGFTPGLAYSRWQKGAFLSVRSDAGPDDAPGSEEEAITELLQNLHAMLSAHPGLERHKREIQQRASEIMRDDPEALKSLEQIVGEAIAYGDELEAARRDRAFQRAGVGV